MVTFAWPPSNTCVCVHTQSNNNDVTKEGGTILIKTGSVPIWQTLGWVQQGLAGER